MRTRIKHKILVLSTAFFFIITALMAQNIEVRKEGLFFNSHEIPRSASSKELERIFGKPDRKSTMESTIWTYDNSGLRIYLKPDSLVLESFEFDFIKGEYNFSPKKTFPGVFMVNNNKISKTTSIDALSKINDIHFHHEVLDLYRASTHDLNLVFTISDDNREIREVAISFKED